MSQQAAPPAIFDERRRTALRERAEYMGQSDCFLWDHIADDISDRLSCINRTFAAPLVIGPLAGMASSFLPDGYGESCLAPMGDAENHFPFAAEKFDLVVAAGTFDSVNDLPGLLLRIRQTLKPDGLFLATLFGAGTLAALKAAMLLADNERATAHIHPQIELKSASDLLTRTGFTLPVADRDGMDVLYTDWRRLVGDLRAHGIGNALSGSRTYLRKHYPERLDAAWHSLANSDGKVAEHFALIHLIGWSPSANQPVPARRGSGKLSLAAVLPDRSR
jgi:NADH dehydrogenase [ubiquinone] 1 alpha subcomplex assembly factor 5